MKKTFICLCAVLALCTMFSACQKEESVRATEQSTQTEPSLAETNEVTQTAAETTAEAPEETTPSTEETTVEKSEKEKRYDRLCSDLEEYVQYSSAWIEELNQQLQNDEAYEYLKNAFTVLGDFMDSKNQLEKLAEAKKEHRYNELCGRMEGFLTSDNIPELEKAFAELGDFKNSKKHLETLAEIKKEMRYMDLCAALEEYGKHSFDSYTYVVELETYLHSWDLYHHLEKSFIELGNYKDSPQMLEKLAEIYHGNLCNALNDIASLGYKNIIQELIARFGFSSNANNSAAWKYIYDGFTDLSKYIDTTDQLKHFTVLKDQLLTVTDSYTDQLGNVIEPTKEPESFLGNDMIPTDVDWVDLLGTNCRIASTERDEQQRISCIKFKENKSYSDLIVCIMTPKYDQNNNIVSMVCKTNSKTWENVYTYNGNRQLISADVCVFWNNGFDDFSYISRAYTFTYDSNGSIASINNTKYSYDENGKLLQKAVYDAESGQILENTEYVYDSQGRPVNVYYSDIYVNREPHPEKYTFTSFDSLGRPLTATVQYSDDQPLHTETYTYGDVYFYVP